MNYALIFILSCLSSSFLLDSLYQYLYTSLLLCAHKEQIIVVVQFPHAPTYLPTNGWTKQRLSEQGENQGTW